MAHAKALLKFFFIGIFSITIVGGIGIALCIHRWVISPPDHDKLADIAELDKGPPLQTTTVRCIDGTIIGQIGPEKRTVMTYEQIPEHVKRAFLAAEDADFFEHPGVSYTAIAKAFVQNLVSRIRGREVKVRGASTITQQIVKLYVLHDGERSLKRKVREAVLAVRLEQSPQWTKQRILGLYLNQIYFGHQRYGVEEASRYYFGHGVEKTTLAEAAYLASLPKAPAYYSAADNRARWMERQRYVLEQMLRHGWVTLPQAQQAALEPLIPLDWEPPQSSAPEWLDLAEAELKSRYGDLSQGAVGGTIFMTCDLRYQAAARMNLETELDRIDRTNGSSGRPQGAVVVIDPASRTVLAMVGGYKSKRGDFNRALFGKRQPGSTFKTFAWAAAFEKQLPGGERITPSTEFEDVVKTYGHGRNTWTPRNHESLPGHIEPTRGEMVTMRHAFARSLNTVAGQVVDRIGPTTVADMAVRLGIVSDLKPGGSAQRSIVLGTSEVTLLELTNAYATIAAQGRRANARFVLQLPDKRTSASHEQVQVISPAQAYQMTSLLEEVIESGTGIRARGSFDRPVAGKTGTTQDSKDAWFVGFSSDLVVGVWIGYDKGESLGKHAEGASMALPIWKATMRQCLHYRDPRSFGPPPHGLVEQGEELYLQGTEPPIVEIPPPDDGGTTPDALDVVPSETPPAVEPTPSTSPTEDSEPAADTAT